MKSTDTLIAALTEAQIPATHSRKCMWTVVCQIGNRVFNISNLAGTERFVRGRLGVNSTLGDWLTQEEAVEHAKAYFSAPTPLPAK